MFNHRPEDYIRQIVTREGVDKSYGLGLRYVGDEASGLATVASTTGDITLEHGDLSSEAADATVGATGVLDLTTYTTIHMLLREINSSPNWEAWAIDVPGDYDTNISAGNGIFAAAGVAAAQCKSTDGLKASFVLDTSLKTAEDYAAGLTLNRSSAYPHHHDGQVLHEIMKISAIATMAGGTDGIYIYECDDVAGTKTEVAHFALATATATDYGTGDEPLISSKSKRLVAMIKATTTITAPKIEIFSRSLAFGPGMDKNKRLSAY